MPPTARGSAGERAQGRELGDHPRVTDESKIATHPEPAWREKTNFILRLDLTADGMPGYFEQVWTRTRDQQRFELCCIPFFTYGLSLGDVVCLTSESGAYRVESKSGHRTIRIAVQDQEYAHRNHQDLHGALAAIGVLMEFRGHADGYWAVDIVDQTQADAVISFLTPLAAQATLMWEWADPVVPD
jgi:hypothetical protein